MSDQDKPRPSRDDYDWEDLPTPSEAEKRAAAEASEAARDEAIESAHRRWTAAERREKLWAWFEAEDGGNLVQMDADGVESFPVQDHIAETIGYLYGFTDAEVRYERFLWQQQRGRDDRAA